MRFPTKTLALAGLIMISSSCATIVSKSKYPVTIDSTPKGADVTIPNRRGDQIFSGKTPTIVKLKSGAGFFTNAKYAIKISKDGFTSKTVELRATLNGWYAGNIIFGGLVGLIIVDPLTGAMYRMPSTIKVDTNSALASDGPRSLQLASIETLTPEQRASLVRL